MPRLGERAVRERAEPGGGSEPGAVGTRCSAVAGAAISPAAALAVTEHLPDTVPKNTADRPGYTPRAVGRTATTGRRGTRTARVSRETGQERPEAAERDLRCLGVSCSER